MTPLLNPKRTAPPISDLIHGTTRRGFVRLLGGGTFAVAFIAACGDDDDPTATPSATAPPTSTPAEAVTAAPTDTPPPTQRVVALGEEWMLADLLSLGIQPISSTASGPDGEFLGGINTLLDVSEVEPLNNQEPDIERVAAIAPDLIITSTQFAENLGDNLGFLEEIATVVAVPVAGPDFKAEYRELAAVFGQEELAEERLAEYDGVLAEVKATIPEGVTTSVATIFDPSYIRVYVGPGVTLTQVLVDLGITLDPDAETLEPTQSAMRAEISGEQINLLTGDHIILLQSEAFDESGVVDAVAALPGWQTLPAVQADQVHIIDRFAHPGLPGRIQAIRDVGAVFS